MKITIDTDLCSFQYKYLINILPNNEKLLKYGINQAYVIFAAQQHNLILKN